MLMEENIRGVICVEYCGDAGLQPFGVGFRRVFVVGIVRLEKFPGVFLGCLN
jgi:hypothetical protein